MDAVQSHNTTFKVKPEISNGIRLMAAVNGRSVAELAEEAVARILSVHSRPVRRLPEKKGVGRPAATIEQAAAAVMRSRPTRNEAIPTRIAVEAAHELDVLAKELSTQMNHLAERGALYLLDDAPAVARAIAGLEGKRAYQKAFNAVRDLATGKISPEDFALATDLPTGAKAVLSERHRARLK